MKMICVSLFALTACATPRSGSVGIQQLVDEEVASLAALPESSLALILVLDPSGAVIAAGGQRGAVVDRTLPEVLHRDPGSVLKTFTIGQAVEEELITAQTTVSGEGGRWQTLGRTITDVTAHQAMRVDDVMAYSSNIGTAKIFTMLGHERLERSLKGLGFSSLPPMPDDASAIGVSFGADFAPTPLELARAYAAIASGRAYPKHTAEVMALLRHTVEREDGTGHGAQIEGVAVAGKTGTWSIDDTLQYADFVGIVPADAPKYIVLVALETRAHGYSGGRIAAPSFSRLASRLISR